MVWRPTQPRPNPLQALRRVVEREPGAAAPDQPTVVPTTAATTARVRLRERPHRRHREPPRPAADPEPSHLRPERPPQAVITSTPTDDTATTLAITPLPPTYEVAATPPAWWLERRAHPAPRPVPTVTPLELAEPRVRGVRQAFTIMVVCLGLWALVDAPALARSAAQGPIGTRRTVALDVLHPLARMSAWLGLDRIDHVASDLLHRHQPTAKATIVTVPRPAPARPAVVVAPVALRVPTAANPLRVLTVGDSLGLSFGQGLATKLDATGVVRTTVDAREGTGLARPDAFDWVAQLRADIVRFHPDVVVASFGGNDDQDVQVQGRFILFNSGPWQAIYAARVQQVVSTVRGAGADLLWSGLPVVRSAAKTNRLMAVMSITRAALGGHDGVVFVDNRTTLADAAGHFATALPDASGNAVIVRQPDGIHETPAGAARLADKAIAAMRTAWKLVL